MAEFITESKQLNADQQQTLFLWLKYSHECLTTATNFERDSGYRIRKVWGHDKK